MASLGAAIRFVRSHGDHLELAPLAADRLNFGDAWEQHSFRWTVPVTNSGTRSVRIDEIEGSCDCTAIAPQEFELAPGETQELSLTINLSQSDWRDDEQARSFETTLRPRLGAEVNAANPVWVVRGHVLRNPISASPAVIDFGNELIAGTPFSSRESVISLAPGNHFARMEASCVPPDAGRAVLDLIDGEPRRYRLSVTPGETLGRGRFTFSVLISARDETEGRGPVLDLKAVGTVQGDIVAQPEKVRFGARPVGSAGVDQVVLFSHQGRPLKVRIVQESSGVTGTPAPGSEPELQIFDLRQQFSRVGEHWGSMQFEAAYIDNDDPPEIILVETSYYGTEPPREAGP